MFWVFLRDIAMVKISIHFLLQVAEKIERNEASFQFSAIFWNVYVVKLINFWKITKFDHPFLSLKFVALEANDWGEGGVMEV